MQMTTWLRHPDKILKPSCSRHFLKAEKSKVSCSLSPRQQQIRERGFKKRSDQREINDAFNDCGNSSLNWGRHTLRISAKAAKGHLWDFFINHKRTEVHSLRTNTTSRPCNFSFNAQLRQSVVFRFNFQSVKFSKVLLIGKAEVRPDDQRRWEKFYFQRKLLFLQTTL